jgi:glycosyltransferase involved in cell wall biosynthesis
MPKRRSRTQRNNQYFTKVQATVELLPELEAVQPPQEPVFVITDNHYSDGLRELGKFKLETLGTFHRKRDELRIAYFVQSYPPMTGEAALSVQRDAEGMAGCGHQALVITPSNVEHPYHILKKNITILCLRSFRNPLRGNQRILLFPRRAILRALHDFGPDVIHTYDPFQMGKIGLTYVRRANVPTILTIHSCIVQPV